MYCFPGDSSSPCRPRRRRRCFHPRWSWCRTSPSAGYFRRKSLKAIFKRGGGVQVPNLYRYYRTIIASANFKIPGDKQHLNRPCD